MPDAELIDPAHQSRDLRMIRAAVKKWWNIPAEVTEKLPQLAWDIAKDDDAAAKDRLSAMKLLATIKGQNDKSGPQPTRRHRHVHTVEPITDANFADRKRALLERANRIGDDTGGTGGTGTDAAGDGIG